MDRRPVALLLGLVATGCDDVTSITLQIAEPLRSDAGAVDGGGAARCHDNPDLTSEQLLAELYQDSGRERCVVLSATPDTADAPRYYAVRTQAIVPAAPDVPPCLGARGAVLLAGLPETNYTLRIMVLDDGALDAARGVPLATQTLQRAGDAWPEAVCFPWFSCAQVQRARSTFSAASSACAQPGVARVARCSLGPSGGTTCSQPEP